LDEAQSRKLSINGVQLLDRIDPNVEFITELASAGCITWPQRHVIIYTQIPRDRNDKLLEFLTRRSVADFQNFINVLAKEQAFLVPLLVTDEGQIIFSTSHFSLAEFDHLIVLAYTLSFICSRMTAPVGY